MYHLVAKLLAWTTVSWVIYSAYLDFLPLFVARSQIPKPTPAGNQESIGLRMASNERKGNRQVYTTNLQKLL
jgi:hypothetical protein